jgi:hypothetical protein
MTEPWQIHVCPVHGQRTPNVLGDCPVGCCAEVMEVVRVVRDTQVDRLNVLGRNTDAHKTAPSMRTAEQWKAIAGEMEATAAILRSDLADARADLEGAVGALAELVRLKDGPRDDAYRAAKDAAWDAAREIIRQHGGQSTAEEAFEQSSGGETLEEAQARQFRGEHAFSPQPDTRGAVDEIQPNTED